VQRNYNKDITDWITIVAWKSTATFISKHFKKGDMICIEGSIQTRDYEDKDGKKVYITEVVAERVHFANNKREANHTATSTADTDDDEFVLLDDDMDLPFN
jgi:single-strand DNA-binding protein